MSGGVEAPSTENQGDAEDEKVMLVHRAKVVEEIITSEFSYVNDLKTLVKHYLKPSKEDSILTDEEVTSIFSNVEFLLGFNEELYRSLRKALGHIGGQSPSETEGTKGGARLGDVFIKLGDFLKMYTVYCNNHTKALENIVKCQQKNQKFAKLLERNSALPECKGLALKDYTIKPVQRLCKYPLLFRELLKFTPISHPDHEVLKLTLAKVQQIADHVNKIAAQQDNFIKMLEVANRPVSYTHLTLPTKRIV
eukprot:TRINITY_DN3200_c0_g2_i5.p1 TRINITY_DN3200_c0_g2~~TRINITY_DN3200_c0_g2_i5.p1  ORF type:complete len:260 (-),score=49.27 TRINITY_DN3200_c0_g2_i5:2-754(-)